MRANLVIADAIDNRPLEHCVVRVTTLLRRIAVLCWALGAMWLVPVGAAAQEQTEESLTQSKASVVRFRGQDLFEVRAPMGKLSPPERARAIEERLGLVANGSADALNAIQVIERERTSDLMAGEQLVLSVTDVDAAPLGRTRQQLAADYAVELERVLRKEFSGRSLRGITTALLLTALATLIFVIAWRALSGFFRRIARLVRSWEGTRITALHVKGVELVSASRMTLMAARAVEMLRRLLILIAALIFLETVLGFFPWTRAAAFEFRAYLWNALVKVAVGTVQYLPNLVYITLIVVVVRVILRGVTLVFQSLKKGDLSLGGFHAEWAEPTSKIVSILIIAFGMVVVFPYLPGADSPAFQGVSIFLGVLVSFGSTSAVSNVVAGIVMTYMIPFRHGDRVQVGDTIGDIVEMNLLVVRIRTSKNVDVTIPNAAVLSGHIINYSARARDEGLIIESTVTIGYDVPWRTVHQLLTSAAAKTTGVAATPPPFVLQTSLDDFYVSYQINAYTAQANRMAVLHGELHQNIQDAFAVAGVEIMSPHYRALRDGGMVTLPSDTLPKGYAAPPIRVAMVPDSATSTSGTDA